MVITCKKIPYDIWFFLQFFNKNKEVPFLGGGARGGILDELTSNPSKNCKRSPPNSLIIVKVILKIWWFSIVSWIKYVEFFFLRGLSIETTFCQLIFDDWDVGVKYHQSSVKFWGGFLLQKKCIKMLNNPILL